MAELLDEHRAELINTNKADLAECDQNDRSIYDRLAINDAKVDGMIDSLKKLISIPSPLDKELYSFEHENGLNISNITVPFGTILIIYESRPDVTVEATATALKSGNKILLKGGKEAKRSNLYLCDLWEKALERSQLDTAMIRYLNYDRKKLQEYLKTPDTEIDLIIPRGGERLIAYVKEVAKCPVLISGRGNNFMYIAESADLDMALSLVVQSKVSKISACNSLDKVLINEKLAESFYQQLKTTLTEKEVEVLEDVDDTVWMEEFLDMKIVLGKVKDLQEAINKINRFSGKHSATIVCKNDSEANTFLAEVDCAAVYHNASTRFTDGFQFGLGAEMAISTEKLHHRGPLGIEQLVTNKWIVRGNGQIR